MKNLFAYALLLTLAAAGCERNASGTATRPTDTELAALTHAVRAEVETVHAQVFPAAAAHARNMARLTGNTRVNGSEGLDKVSAYIGEKLTEYQQQGVLKDVRRVTFPATAAVDEGTELQVGRRRIEAYGCLPNNCMASATSEPVSAELVYGGHGALNDLYGRDLKGRLVVLEMASGDAWMDCMRLGAAGAVFLGDGETSVFQADRKFIALLPIDFPRLFVPRSSANYVRRAAEQKYPCRFRVGVAMRNVEVPVWEAYLPGTAGDGDLLLSAHIDSYSITPGLAPGGSEIYGPAVLLAAVEFFSRHKPALGLRIVFYSGQRPDQAGPRRYLAAARPDGPPLIDLIGEHIAAAIAVDLCPGSDGLTVSENGAPGFIGWQYGHRDKWLEQRLFPRQGWWYDVLCAAMDVESLPLYGNHVPVHFESEGSIAPRAYNTPFVFNPQVYTSQEPFFAAGGPGYRFQTSPEHRFGIFTPDDVFQDDRESLARVESQAAMLFPILSRMAELPVDAFNYRGSRFKKQLGVGGYVEIHGQVGVYKQEKVWYDWGPPRDADGNELGATFVTAVPSVMPLVDPGVIPGPRTPWLQMHRGLQMFMNYYIVRVDGDGRFFLPGAYAKMPEMRYHFLAVTVDDSGNITYANDLGMHGDVAFRCRNRELQSWSSSVKLNLFPCGTLVLFDLFDPERYAFNRPVPNENWQHWGWPGHTRHTQDDAEFGLVPVREIREADTQMDAEFYGFLQYGEEAVVFLPSDKPCIVLAGRPSRKFLALGRFGLDKSDGSPRAQGYSLKQGERVVFHDPIRRYYEELSVLDRGRITAFGGLGVKSPQAEKYHANAAALAGSTGDAEISGPDIWARLVRAWQEESRAYAAVLTLKFDVVKTTVFYFILLIPFAFLAERLIIPQVSIGRTLAVAGGFFIVFALALWKFHPGFHLAENVFITILSFIIVLLTIPALILLLGRGTSLLKSIAGRYAQAHYAKEERAGMLVAALSLTVSNMRRRRLRTALTLGTITLLVLSLVLLTSFTAVDQVYQRPEKRKEAPAYQGVAVYNTYQHSHALLPQVVRIIEASYGGRASVLRREYLNYGYQDSGVVRLIISPARGLPADWKDRVDAIRKAGTTKKIQEETLDLIYHDSGLVVPTIQVVDPGEKDVTGADSAVIQGRGRWFEPSDAYHCLLSKSMAGSLGVDAGDQVRLAGRVLTVRGVFDEQAMDSIKDLNGDPFTPLLFTTQQESPEHPTHQPSSNVVFLPAAFNRAEGGLLPTAVWAVVVIPDDPEEIGPIGEELARELRNVDIYISRGGSVTVLSAHAGLAVKGGAMLAGPLVVTFFLILNIMLGTVYERTREINIFSSVGLSPKHVAGMFLTESLVYAGIASVLGYFIGIVLLYFFRHWGLLPKEFAPNYLGAVVIYATGLAVAATVLSSIYPMIVAARIVNPSLERSWHVPTEPEGKNWEIPFPFIATTRDEAMGILEFVREFVAYNVGEPRGVFAAGEKIILVRDPGRLGYGLEFDAWLAPFERNVTQKVLFVAHKDPEGRPRWHFAFIVSHVSGPDYLWLRSNRHFVDAFRKQMLLWRAFPDSLVDEFAQRGTARWVEDPDA
ncbi:MAG: FtsX-like permease family protein [Planctomycetes bacterium]|nr:FtsX-like permease family protein [Planctomycetota bacterium]